MLSSLLHLPVVLVVVVRRQALGLSVVRQPALLRHVPGELLPAVLLDIVVVALVVYAVDWCAHAHARTTTARLLMGYLLPWYTRKNTVERALETWIVHRYPKQPPTAHELRH